MNGLSVRTKILISMVGIAVIGGALMFLLIRSTAIATMEAEVLRRGQAIAHGTAVQALPLVLEQNVVGLVDLCAAVQSPELRYVYVADGYGNLLASSMGTTFPNGLEAMNIPAGDASSVAGVILDGKKVYDVAFPLEGAMGAAHVGLFEDRVADAAARISRVALIVVIAVVTVSILVAVILSAILTRPIRALTRFADDISRGNFAAEVPVQSPDEIGRLAASLDRMRASLQVMMNEAGQVEGV